MQQVARAAYLEKHNISVDVVDCTFLGEKEAVERIKRSKPKVIGIQSMFSLKNKAIRFASLLRDECELLVAGGPQPTSNPEEFLQHFDVAVVGEGEQTMLELVREKEGDLNLSKVDRIAYKEEGKTRFTPPREFIRDLDSIPFPAGELFDNEAYMEYYSRNCGYTITSVMIPRDALFNAVSAVDQSLGINLGADPRPGSWMKWKKWRHLATIEYGLPTIASPWVAIGS
jgi:radical SAM superfamily enzyme YgiQ (UPF0313 family)